MPLVLDSILIRPLCHPLPTQFLQRVLLRYTLLFLPKEYICTRFSGLRAQHKVIAFLVAEMRFCSDKIAVIMRKSARFCLRSKLIPYSNTVIKACHLRLDTSQSQMKCLNLSSNDFSKQICSLFCHSNIEFVS